ncbi:natriuretic peptides A-like isoform X1 [Pezoporus wallicus]|uniref:natriuretic peptides A-like isoform X1 n=1 Tax=Pezoporus wallicus TaxID=35540 RepID=UPI002550BE18|nr:natriuretic peptides A-like isoform X1 [Pezoporus wallicus]XP_061306003.1 natriuretic peptides A-like isoform X1 [Pezoporus flaviventris]
MHLPALCCGASLLLLVLPWAGTQPAGGEHGAELRSLQDLLEALGQLREEEGESGPEDESATGAEDGGSEWELSGPEGGPPGTPLPAEGWQSQWRSLLSSYRRRHFSGCFGTRMERIGAQTGLGCNQYKARRSPRRRERGEAGARP